MVATNKKVIINQKRRDEKVDDLEYNKLPNFHRNNSIKIIISMLLKFDFCYVNKN